MSTMNISLPDALRTFVEERVAEGGYGSTSEYVRELIRRELDRTRVRDLLLEGAQSAPGVTADDRYVEGLRERIHQEVTMLEFRRNVRRALEAVRRGERMLLTYRDEPIARLEPVRPEPSAVPDDDPLLRIEDFAVDGPDGPLPNEAIDRIVYEVLLERE